MSHGLPCHQESCHRKDKEPSTRTSYFHHVARNWQVKQGVLCHKCQEQSGIQIYDYDWNLKKCQERKDLGAFFQGLNFTSHYSLLPGTGKKAEKDGAGNTDE